MSCFTNFVVKLLTMYYCPYGNIINFSRTSRMHSVNQQTINRLRRLTLHWTSIAISHRSGQPVSRIISPSEKSPSVEIVTPDCTCSVLSSTETLLRSGKNVFAPWWISYNNEIAAGKLFRHVIRHGRLSNRRLHFMAPCMPCCYGRIWHYLQLTRALHFCKFFKNPHFDLEPVYIFGKPMKRRFQHILSMRKYCQLFTYESNTFLCKKYIILPIQTNGGTNAEKSPKQPFPFCGKWTPCNTWMPGPTSLTTPNDNSIGSHTSAQICDKIPIGYNGTPYIHPKTVPFPSTITTPSNTPIPRPTPLTTSNGIRIQSAVLPQYTLWTNRQTDRGTDGPGECSVTRALSLRQRRLIILVLVSVNAAQTYSA